jgi:hypothetical protein
VRASDGHVKQDKVKECGNAIDVYYKTKLISTLQFPPCVISSDTVL